jgi:hypothetical protein
MADYHYLRRQRIPVVRAAIIAIRRAWYSRKARKAREARLLKGGGK